MKPELKAQPKVPDNQPFFSLKPEQERKGKIPGVHSPFLKLRDEARMQKIRDASNLGLGTAMPFLQLKQSVKFDRQPVSQEKSQQLSNFLNLAEAD